MKKKPRLSFWQIWNMSFGFLGIQFGFALQNANVSRIFETLGADIERIPILWIAAPVTGLLVQPIIGHMSDNTWNRLGRRRPFFLVGAILASIALIIMPNSPALWVAAGMLWIMDASINISMEPFRAFVGDMLPSDQRTTGFAMQSFFIGIGAVIASALPWMLTNWLNIPNTAPEGEIAPSVKFSFYIGGAVFLLAVLWTVFRTKEYSPEELEEFGETEDESPDTPRHEPVSIAASKFIRNGIIWIISGIILTLIIIWYHLMPELYIFSTAIGFFGIIQLISGLMGGSDKSKSAVVTIVNDFYLMPKTMVQLAFVQFFSWFALFAMWIYTTAGVTSHVYDMKMQPEIVNYLHTKIVKNEDKKDQARYVKLPDIKEELEEYQEKIASGAARVTASMKVVKFFADSAKMQELSLSPKAAIRIQNIQEEYNEGADWVGVCFSIYNGFAAVFAFLLMWLAKKNQPEIHAHDLLNCRWPWPDLHIFYCHT